VAPTAPAAKQLVSRFVSQNQVSFALTGAAGPKSQIFGTASQAPILTILLDAAAGDFRASEMPTPPSQDIGLERRRVFRSSIRPELD
jgi:hypothetical protein